MTAAARLSVLDQSPVPAGTDAGTALRNTLDLARRVDQLGYHRYWVAEHHNMEGLAGASPEVLIPLLAQATKHLRVGSGGVMLTHYSPYKVAENFRVLEALFPGRIDLGLGRAPGSDMRTAYALARGTQPVGPEHYPAMVAELQQFLADELPADHPLTGVHARPLGVTLPELWLLASSIDSASLAAHLGLPLGWAYFIAAGGEGVVRAYREGFRPSSANPLPRVGLGVGAICAETHSEAERLASSVRLWRARGLQGALPLPSDQAVHGDHLRIRRPLAVGTAAEVKAELDELAEAFGADELVVVTICHDHAARVRSYELLAEAYELTPAS
jgi:luciferase family oxidoreductase group 1